MLREAAIHGAINTRWAAVNAIGEIGGAKATGDARRDPEDRRSQGRDRRGQALAANGGPEARELLIEAALADRAQITGALGQLAQMEGEDVDQALISVIKQGSSADRRAALPRLLKTGNPEALHLAMDLASKGSRNERYDAMRMLADAGTPRDVRRAASTSPARRAVRPGSTRSRCSRSRARAIPALGQLLSDSLFSGRRDEACYAASVLGRIGTEDARQALVAALTGKDKELAAAAAGALGQVGMTDSVKTALLSAAQSNPQVKMQVMNQLVQAGAPEGMRLAEEMLGGKEPGMASQAVWALAGQGTPEARR